MGHPSFGLFTPNFRSKILVPFDGNPGEIDLWNKAVLHGGEIVQQQIVLSYVAEFPLVDFPTLLGFHLGKVHVVEADGALGRKIFTGKHPEQALANCWTFAIDNGHLPGTNTEIVLLGASHEGNPVHL